MTKKEFNDTMRANRLDYQILGRITLDDRQGGAQSFLCNTINISMSGVFVETGSMLPMGSLLNYSFCVPGGEAPLSITGEVVRGVRQPPGKKRERKTRALNRYGIMFLDMNDADRRVMESFLAKNGSGPDA